MRRSSTLATSFDLRRWRRRLASFVFIMCRRPGLPRLMRPDLVSLRRFAAPLLVFSFGIERLLPRLSRTFRGEAEHRRPRPADVKETARNTGAAIADERVNFAGTCRRPALSQRSNSEKTLRRDSGRHPRRRTARTPGGALVGRRARRHPHAGCAEHGWPPALDRAAARYFRASSIVMRRPSCFGGRSTLATSWRSTTMRSKSLRPRSL